MSRWGTACKSCCIRSSPSGPPTVRLIPNTKQSVLKQNVLKRSEFRNLSQLRNHQALSLENKEVTAVASRLEPVVRSSGIAGSSLPHGSSESTVDFSFVREQIGFDRVLSHLGLRDTFRGQIQLRGACPLCESANTFSVNLKKNVYRCFHSSCSKGNVLDFRAALKGAPLLTAAHDLAHTFGLETQRIQPPQPQKIPPKENPKKSGVITPDAS